MGDKRQREGEAEREERMGKRSDSGDKRHREGVGREERMGKRRG